MHPMKPQVTADMTYEDNARSIWGTQPTFYWLEESQRYQTTDEHRNLVEKTDFNLRVMQRPIDTGLRRYFAAEKRAPHFGGIIWADSMQSVYDNTQLWNYLLEHDDFPNDHGKSDLTNVKYILEQIRKDARTDVVLVIYDTTNFHLDDHTDVLDLNTKIPVHYDFFMLWLYEQGKEYFTSMSALRFRQYADIRTLRSVLSSPTDQLLSKL